jgi:hypothetical protein
LKAIKKITYLQTENDFFSEMTGKIVFHYIYLNENIYLANGMQKDISFSKILEFLTDLIDNKTSGTLYVISECNHAGTISLDKGEINAIYFGARRGQKAIPMISNISRGCYRFEGTNLVERTHELPPTHEILNLLRNPHILNTSSPTASTPANANELITDENKSRLCRTLKHLLAEHIGPIADMVIDDAVDEIGDFCSTPQLTQDLIDKLSEEIDDNNEVKQFRNKAYAALKDIL